MGIAIHTVNHTIFANSIVVETADDYIKYTYNPYMSQLIIEVKIYTNTYSLTSWHAHIDLFDEICDEVHSSIYNY